MKKEIQITPDQQMIQVAQQFLQRCDLKGGEVDAYAKAFNFLQAIVDNEIMIVPTGLWESTTKELEELKTKLKEFEDSTVEDDEVVEIVGFIKPTLGDEEETPSPSDLVGSDTIVELEDVESDESD